MFPGRGLQSVSEATLCHPVREGELLLMRKKRGPGAGNLIAPGGKLEGDEPFMFVHVFLTRSFVGRARETAEGDPAWYPVDDLPYGEMWPDDRYWLPLLLDGERFRGRFRFDADGEELLAHEVETGVEF